MNVKYFFCLMVYSVTLSLSFYYCKIFKFCFWVFCGDVLVSDGTGGLIAMV